MNDVIGLLFMLISFTPLILLVAVVFALLGWFSDNAAVQAEHYAMAAKILLLFALIVVIGLGSCFAALAL